MSNPVVEFINVTYKSDTGGTVFGGLHFKLMPERSAIIVGSAGSGKTTLVDLIVGRRFADQGTVKVFGETMQRRKKGRIRRVRQKIGGVGGRYRLLPLLTAAENITLPLVISSARRRARQDRLMKALTEFSLLKQAGLLPEQLTRVENTMVQLARATVSNQPLIIIDEPLAGLDVKTYRRVTEFLFKMAVSGRSMVILTAEPPTREIPGADLYEIANGVLQ